MAEKNLNYDYNIVTKEEYIENIKNEQDNFFKEITDKTNNILFPPKSKQVNSIIIDTSIKNNT